MVADNPGTWLFHCQVTDHMEAGMMATYTIYPPAPNSCPVEFGEGDFWSHPKELSVTVRNTSKKTISAPGSDSGRVPFAHGSSDLPYAVDVEYPDTRPASNRRLKSKNFYQSSGIIGMGAGSLPGCLYRWKQMGSAAERRMFPCLLAGSRSIPR